MGYLRLEGSYNIDGLVEKVKRLSTQQAKQKIADKMVLHVSTYISKGAGDRHKWSNKLGAEPTGVLEFAPSERVSTSKGGGKIYADVEGDAAVVKLANIKGISRAFKDLEITPKSASALTVPIHRESYAKTVGEMTSAGWNIFRRGRVLMGAKGSSSGMTVPLFVLCGHVHIDKDPELLPSSSQLYQWAINEANREINSVGW